MTGLRLLALEAVHSSMGARFGEFAGWRMPLWYSGAVEEHLAVRGSAGVFDISHMGRFRVEGEGAPAFLASLFSRDPSRMGSGDSLYCLACNDRGGIVDDLIVYKLADTSFVIICNAANAGSIEALLRRTPANSSLIINDLQPQTVLLAVQGPEAVQRTASALALPELRELPRRACRELGHGGERYFFSRSGYTGEDGFEILTSVSAGEGLFQRLTAEGVLPCGLAARDSLRLEAALPLHGHDIDETTSPWEAGLGWAVELDHDFLGRDALLAAKDAVAKRLSCLVSDGQGVFRSEQEVYSGDEMVGHVTSGGFSPSLRRSIAMAYLPLRLAIEVTKLEIDSRGRRIACHIVKRSFYKSPDLARKRQA